MSLTLIFSLIALISIAYFGRHFIQLPKNVWLLFLAQPLAMASASMVVFAGGLVASKIAPNPELTTLPLSLMILGTAAGVIPASMLMKKVGRKRGTIIGLSIAIIGALLCTISTLINHFILLVCGAILLGSSMAFVAQMRFAALESLTDPIDAPKAISVLMIGGMFAAILGPEVAVIAKDWIFPEHEFAGSFFALSILILSSIIVLSRLDPIKINTHDSAENSRPILQIIKQPIFIIAVCSGAIAYSIMSYIMTAAPLSMHEIDGHDLIATKWVIQSHIIAMYFPSFFTPIIIRYIGVAKLMIVGCIIYGLVVVIALSGHQVMHYWWAMILLGIGWNFLFSSGTLLLPNAYLPQERFKAQATNDFFIFFIQSLSSLSAGLILFGQGWGFLIMASLPIILIMFVVSIWYYFKQRMLVIPSA